MGEREAYDRLDELARKTTEGAPGLMRRLGAEESFGRYFREVTVDNAELMDRLAGVELSEETGHLATPGEILFTEFLEPWGISQSGLARELGVSRSRVSRLVRGESRMTGEMAVRLGVFFGLSADFWMGLQAEYDLFVARRVVDAGRVGGWSGVGVSDRPE
ncbi:HigA family addiction module antitoxin [Corynebacterium sp. AOP36-E1-14]|uniref:HigA family addiction module antitoxin n=1 Tax=unclassified Corynebacterium TaxID=2624378 RepID=UPI004033C99A